MFLNNNWILLEFLKTFIKVYVRQVFVVVRRNFIFSGHNVQQVLKNYLQPCVTEKGSAKDVIKYRFGHVTFEAEQFLRGNCLRKTRIKHTSKGKFDVL